MSTEKILEERQKTHGDFSSHAVISQRLKQVIYNHNPVNLSASQKEALEMICHKIARILNGNPDFKDHWDDIAGYATLVSLELESQQQEFDIKIAQELENNHGN